VIWFKKSTKKCCFRLET